MRVSLGTTTTRRINYVSRVDVPPPALERKISHYVPRARLLLASKKARQRDESVPPHFVCYSLFHTPLSQFFCFHLCETRFACTYCFNARVARVLFIYKYIYIYIDFYMYTLKARTIVNVRPGGETELTGGLRKKRSLGGAWRR